MHTWEIIPYSAGMLPPLPSSASPIAPPAALPAAPFGGRRRHAPKAALCALTLLAAGGLLLACGSRPVVLLLFAPVLEEIVFRLGLQQRLLTAGVAPVAANLLTATAFGALHAFTRSWVLGAAVLLPALAIGRIYQRRRRVLPCIAAHAGMNLVWLLAGAASAAWPVPAPLFS